MLCLYYIEQCKTIPSGNSDVYVGFYFFLDIDVVVMPLTTEVFGEETFKETVYIYPSTRARASCATRAHHSVIYYSVPMCSRRRVFRLL